VVTEYKDRGPRDFKCPKVLCNGSVGVKELAFGLDCTDVSLEDREGFFAENFRAIVVDMRVDFFIAESFLNVRYECSRRYSEFSFRS
jgi:hypothetical protein